MFIPPPFSLSQNCRVSELESRNHHLSPWPQYKGGNRGQGKVGEVRESGMESKGPGSQSRAADPDTCGSSKSIPPSEPPAAGSPAQPSWADSSARAGLHGYTPATPLPRPLALAARGAGRPGWSELRPLPVLRLDSGACLDSR